MSLPAYLVCTVNLTLSFSERASEMSTWRGVSESELRSTSAVLRLGITLTPSMVIEIRSGSEMMSVNQCNDPSLSSVVLHIRNKETKRKLVHNSVSLFVCVTITLKKENVIFVGWDERKLELINSKYFS